MQLLTKATQPSFKSTVEREVPRNGSLEKIRRLKPSGRGELEITDVHNFYIEDDTLSWDILQGWWTDAGTFESLLRANTLVAKTGAIKMDLRSGTGAAAPSEVTR